MQIHPLHPSIIGRLGLNVNFVRKQIAAFLHGFFDQRLHLLDHFGMILVPHARANQMRWVDALFAKHFHHVLGAVALGIELAAVADERDIQKIACVIGHIVDTPELLFIPDRILVGRELLIAFHIRETGSSVNAGPLVGVMRAEMPGSGSTHAETRERNPVLVHLETGDSIIAAFEDIDFAR